METIQELVRNLIIILLLAMVLEMILPNKSMRGIVQLVMGLFVISAILSPVANLFQMPLELEIPAWSTTEGDVPVMATDQIGADLGQNAVEEQYRLILVRQIRALALGVSGVQDASVEVEFEGAEQESGNVPIIKQVEIEIVTDGEEIRAVSPVEPIIVGNEPIQAIEMHSSLGEEVKQRVSVFMEIPLERVSVRER